MFWRLIAAALVGAASALALVRAARPGPELVLLALAAGAVAISAAVRPQGDVATRTLLAETSRAAERVRISRELHDALGHHLTALLQQLESAALRPDADPLVCEALAQARAVFTEVRSSLADLRRRGAADVRPALRELAVAIRRPRVHIDFDGEPGIPASLSHAVFRCVQEIVTNSARHAGAQNLWIACTVGAAAVEIRARDDGRGADGVRPGAGLRGMRERLAEAGGNLEVHTAPGQGFSVRVWLPLEPT
jgi:signal transduction histidine kinase